MLTQALAVLGTVAAFVWGAYKWFVTRPRDLAELDLLTKQLHLQEALPYLEFAFECASHPCDLQQLLLVSCTARNRGRRAAACDLSHPDLLTIVPVTIGESQVAYGQHHYSTYVRCDGGQTTRWSTVVIPPEATKTFPFALLVSGPGVYLLEVKIPVDVEADGIYRGRSKLDPSKSIFWSGSTYVNVPGVGLAMEGPARAIPTVLGVHEADSATA
jgi:hypothetical protein